jgi:hypothetical protein
VASFWMTDLAMDFTKFLRIRKDRLEVLIVGIADKVSYYARKEGYLTPLTSKDRAIWISNKIKEYCKSTNINHVVLDCRLEEYTNYIARDVIKELELSPDQLLILTSSDPKNIFSGYDYIIDNLGDINTYFFYSDLLKRNIDWENIEIDIPIISLAGRPTEKRARFMKGLADLTMDKARLSFGNLLPEPLEDQEYNFYADILYPHSFPLMQNTDGVGISYDHVGENLFHSLVSVINETNDFDNESILLTEKTFKAFAWHQIPIFNATKGHVEIVRSLGFDLFDDIINHNYDTSPNIHIQKLKILNVVAKFLKDYPTLEDVNNLRKSIFHRLQANNELLYKLYEQRPYEPWPCYG